MPRGEELLLQQKVDGINRIRPDFSRQMKLGNASVQVLINAAPTPTRPASSRAIRKPPCSQWYARQSARGDAQFGRTDCCAESALRFNEANDSHYFLVPGLIVLVMTLIGALMTAMVMSREWERGTLEALFVTPVRVEEILLGKMIPYFVLGMIGLATACLLSAKFLFHVPFRGSLWMHDRRCRCCILRWSRWRSGLLISSRGEEPVRRQPGGNLLTNVSANADAYRDFYLDLHSMRTGVRPRDFLCDTGKIVTSPCSERFFSPGMSGAK